MGGKRGKAQNEGVNTQKVCNPLERKAWWIESAVRGPEGGTKKTRSKLGGTGRFLPHHGQKKEKRRRRKVGEAGKERGAKT